MIENKEIGLVVAVWNKRDTLTKRDEVLVLVGNNSLGWAFVDGFRVLGEP